MKKRIIFLSLVIGLFLFFIFKNMCFSCLFMPREFIGEADGLLRGPGEIGLRVRQLEDESKMIFLAMVSDPLPPDRMLPGADQEILDLNLKAYEENKRVRVKVLKWENENTGIGLIYFDDEDITISLIRKGYLVINPDSRVKVDRETHSLYKEAERSAKKEKNGIWKLEECLD